jgi:hypothetical protein
MTPHTVHLLIWAAKVKLLRPQSAGNNASNPPSQAHIQPNTLDNGLFIISIVLWFQKGHLALGSHYDLATCS